MQQHDVTTDGFPFTRHLERCTIVLPEHRVLYVPVPKSAWTSVLRMLLRPAGLTAESFVRSGKPEVTLAMAIHDTRVWRRAGVTLGSLPDDVRDRALGEDGWFRFSVVRDPATRLWSAWQSKLLLREPAFADAFGDQPWFPRVPRSSHDVLEDFRVFVASLRERAWKDDVRDKHWAPQHVIVDRIPLNHVGQMERLGETRDALRAHLGRHGDLTGPMHHDNRTPLPCSPAVYDEATASAVRELFAADFTRFGYRPPRATADAESLAEWERHVEEVLPAMREVIARHERLGAYYRRLGANKRRLARVRTQSEARRRRVQQLELQLAARTQQRDRLRSRLEAQERSWSWRLTRPLRLLRRVGRSGARRQP